MQMKMLKNNLFTPLVGENEWHNCYPSVDREYVWSYPLLHGDEPFSPEKIFGKSRVPIISKDTVVYIHVPACLFRCPMCPFYVELIKNRQELQGYADSVLREIDMYACADITHQLNLKTIYFGGGTAALLYPEDIARIIDKIKNVFPNNEDIEITVEGHPSVVDYNYLSALKSYGVNRVSFGIQSFNSEMLRQLGLKQTAEENRKVLEECVQLGFNTIAADMLYRIPGQTTNALEEQLKIFLDTGITSLSAYSLELSVRQGELMKRQPSEAVDKEMFYLINDYMNAQGWDHTAQPDYAHKDHIQKEILTTWKAPQGQTIGLGAGACSSFNGVNYYNVHDINEYKNAVSEGCLPVLIGQQFTLEDAMSRYAVLGARCFSLPNKPFRDAFGVDFVEVFGTEIRLLKQQGLIEEKGWGVEVTRKGKYYIDNISKTFYSLVNRCHLQPWGEKMKGAVATSYLKVL